jgi:P pilus assembly chaperone PapD
MKRLGGVICGVVLLIALGVAARAATSRYASLQLAPDAVTLGPNQRVGQLFMNSLDARPAIFEAEALAWRQDGGTDVLAPSPDVLTVPTVFDVQPYERQSIRVTIADSSFGDVERAFQLHFHEVPQPGSSGPAREFMVPMFVSPRARSGSVEYSLRSTGARGAELIVRNASNEHVQLRSLEIVQGDESCYNGSPKQYVLAESTRVLSLPVTCDLQNGPARAVVSGESGQTSIDVNVR